jgi:hypothetical protein
MKRTMKQILSVVLVLVMCFSAVIPAFAATETCPGATKDHFKSNCTWKKIDTYAPKCGERGYTVYQCTKCNKYFADDFVENKEAHNYETIKEETCYQIGEKKCSKCGDVKEINTFGTRDAKGEVHNWNPAGKCGEPGTKFTQTCTRCKITREVEADGTHSWNKPVVVREPICGVDGLATYTCNSCGYVKEVAIDCETADAGGHKWAYVEATKKTCTTDGNTAGYVCSNEGCTAIAPIGTKFTTVDADGKEIEVTVDKLYEVIPAGHSYGTGATAYVDATCTTPGYFVYVCTDCKDAYMEEDENAPALGHLSGTITTDTVACAIEGGKFVPGKTTTTGTCGRVNHGVTCQGETEGVKTHEYDEVTVDATCMVGGYTIYICKDGCASVQTAAGKPNPENHNYKWFYTGSPDLVGIDPADLPDLTHTTAPTCTETGYGWKACINGACDVDMELGVIPALGHEYINEDGTYNYDYAGVKYNCATGKWDFTCAVCTASNAVTESVAIENFDINNYKHHIDWVEDGDWDGVIEVIQDNGCGKNAIVGYHCTCGKVVLDIVENGHKEPAAGTNAANAPTCLNKGNYEWFVCAACTKVCYYNADGVLVEAGETKAGEDPEYVIPATGCSIVIDQVYVAGICGAPGKTAAWHCENANCDVAVGGVYDAKYFELDADGNVMVLEATEEAASKLQGTSAASVAIEVGHNWKITTEKQDLSCLNYRYVRYACEHCDTWEWRNYKAATDHNIVETKAECTVNGYEVCENTWCDYAGKDKLTSKNPTYKEIVSVGHTDANGKPIICVSEDFWCAVCRPELVPAVPADPKDPDKMMVNPLGKLDYTESHNTAGGDWIAVYEQYKNAYYYEKHGGMIPTKLNAVNDCTVWNYLLYVCPDCEIDEKGGHFNDEVEPCKEHTIVYRDSKGKVITYTKDSKVEDIPAELFTVVVKEATFAEAGTLGAPCTCGGCEQIVATKPYVRNDIGFDIKVDSAIVSGADIVDSGTIKVDILANAYDVDVYSIYFDLAYNANHLEFVKATLPDGSKFGASGLRANANNGEVSVYLANYGEKLTNLDFNLFGKQMVVVTLEFKVKNVNKTGLGKTASALALNDISVLKADSTHVAVASNNADVKKGSILTENMTIWALGNVTKGVVENQDKRIDDFDTLNWEGLFVGGKYLAAADINKNGELDGQDYDAIAQYIVGALDYDQLCAIYAK